MITSNGKEIKLNQLKINERYTEDLSYSNSYGTISYRNTDIKPLYKGIKGIDTIYYYETDMTNGDLEFDKMIFKNDLKLFKIKQF